MTTPTNPSDRPGVNFAQAKAILEEKGLDRSIKTLKRWVNQGILSMKKISKGTVILFRDEVEALVAPDDPDEQRLESAKSLRRTRQRRE